MAPAAPCRRSQGPLRALVALGALLAAAPAWADPGAFAREVAEFARDLAAGDGSPSVDGPQVDFALRVVAPFGVRAEPDGLQVGLLRGPHRVFVPYSALSNAGTLRVPDGKPPFGPGGRDALGRAAVLFAALEGRLAYEVGPVRARDLLRTSAGHFGLRPFGVQEGPSVRARARASSLRWLRSRSAGPPDESRGAAALALWRSAAALRPEGSFYIDGAAVLDAVRETAVGTDPEPEAARARDSRLYALFVRLMEQDKSLEPLDPYAADILAQALERLGAGRLTPRSGPPPAARAPAAPPMFKELTRGSGLDINPPGDRVSVGGALLDYDGDGRLDLCACVGSLGGRLIRNLGGLRIAYETARAGLEGSYCRAAAADYDGDGDPDLALSDSMGAPRLMRNDGGRFVDVSREAGLPPEPMPTQSLVWFDSDGDGRLDLYLVNHGGIVEGNAPYAGDALNGVPNRLLRQSAPGRFSDVPDAAGAGDRRWGRGAVAADLDGDGRTDLAVANDFGAPRILLSSAGAFVDATAASGVGGLTHSLGVSAADFDGDGIQDLLFSSFDRRWAPSPSLSDPSPRTLVDAESFWMGEEVSALMRPQLYRGLGGGRFAEEWERFVPAVYTGAAWNGTFVDLDSDGHQDIVFAAGFHPDCLFFHSDRGVVLLYDEAAGRFRDASSGSGLDFADSSRAGLYGDLDGDGDLDAVVLGYSGPRVFRNDAPARSWAALTLRARGGKTAYGAEVAVSCAGREQKFLYGTFGGGFVSSFSGSLFAGLGGCEGPVSARVRWPSGGTQTLQVPARRLSVVSEADVR
ncbi:MAG: VCBS repeat-containing protein [Elusimicrobia bacterium]|nr:VCBS repeat-containing protein [Elusimicrobiota bacterium]